MIELRTLGAIEINRADGSVSPSLVSRTKMLGLLVYLALRGQGEGRQRAELCVLFWPESDARRGRNSLSQTLHALRTSLGSGLIVGGRQTVGLDPELITCDAIEFRQALSNEDWQAALDLYRGDFLPGLHLSGAPDFDRWVEEQRATLRREAFDAALRLARSRQSSGDDRGHISALRRARTIRPEDDGTVRDLMAACIRVGNAGAALREFESYRTYLQEEFGLEPPDESTTLYRELADRLSDSNRSDALAPGGAARREPAGRLPSDGLDGERGKATTPRIPRAVPVAVVLVGIFTAITLFLGVSSRPEEDRLDEYRIAVLPVRVSSEDDRLTALALARGLDGWADLARVEPSRLDAAVAAADKEVLGPDEGDRIARSVGAGRFVLVRSEPRDGRPGMRAELYASGDADGAIALVDTAGTANESSDELYVDVLLSLFRGQAVGVAPGLREAEWIAEPRAMFPYYSALAHENRGELDSAIACLAEAVGIDSTFGAAWDLMAALAVKAEPVATTDWERRNRYRAIRDTALAYAAVHYSEPEFSPAGLAHAKRLAELFPDSIPLQWSVGMMYWDLSLERGFDPDSALPYFERAAALDSLQDVSRLITFHMLRGRLLEARRLVDRSNRNGVGIFRADFL